MIYENDKIIKVTNLLSKKEASIVESMYGVNGKEKISNEEIMMKYGVSDIELSLLINKIEYMLENVEGEKEFEFNYSIDYQEDKTFYNEKNGSKHDNEVTQSKDTSKYKEKNNKWLYEYLVEGKQEAYIKLVENNVSFIHYIVNKYYNGEDYDEFVSIARNGLIKAINTFKIEKIGEINFATYASVVMKNEIFMGIRKANKYEKTDYFSDPVSGYEEDFTLEDMLASDVDVLEEYVAKEDILNKKKFIEKTLNSLGGRKRKIIELLYGFGGQKPMTQSEIGALLGLSQSYVCRLIASAENELRELLVEYKDEYSIKKENNNIKRMNDTFYKFFKCINKEEILYLLNQFKDRKYVSLYYGLDGKRCLDYDEIAIKFNVSVDEVDEKIEKVIISIKNFYDTAIKDNKINEYRNLIEKYGACKVNEAMRKLSKVDRTMILDYYLFGFDLKFLMDKYHMHRKQGKVDIIIKNLCEFIENPDKVSKRRKVNEDKLNMLVTKYGKDNVMKAIKILGKKGKKIICLYYGLDGNVKKNHKEISKLMNINITSSPTILSKNLMRIKDKLESFNNPKEEALKKRFYDLINCYGKEEVLKVVNTYNYKNKKIIYMFLGLNGEKEKNLNEINYHLRCKDSLHIIETVFEKLEDKLSYIKKDDKPDKIKEGLKTLIKNYGEEKVDVAISKLSNEHKNIFSFYYELYKKDHLNNVYSRINEKNNVNDSYMIIYASLKRIKFILGKPDDKKLKTDISKEKFNKLIGEYGKEAVFNELNKLEEDDKKILTMYLGLNAENPKSLNEIRKILNIDIKRFKICNILKYLETHLKNPNIKHYRETFNQYIENYSDKKILSEINNMGALSKNIICMYYGLEGKNKNNVSEISEAIGAHSSNIYNLINTFNEYLNAKMNDNKEDVEHLNFRLKKLEAIFRGLKKGNNSLIFMELVDEYGIKEIEKRVSNLNDKQQQIMNLYFGLNGNQIKETEEIEKLLGNNISMYVKKSLNKIKNSLLENNEKRKTIKEKRETFKDLLKIKDDKKIEMAIKQLSENEKVILFLYFGLNCKNIMSSEELCERFDIDKETLKSKLKDIVNKINNFMLNSIKK